MPEPNQQPYPTFEQVEAADHEQLCRWYRFLPIADDWGDIDIMNRIIQRVRDLGGFTPEISKKIGWEG